MVGSAAEVMGSCQGLNNTYHQNQQHLIPRTTTNKQEMVIEEEEDLLMATSNACEQILNKLLPNTPENINKAEVVFEDQSCQDWEASFNELFPDLA